MKLYSFSLLFFIKLFALPTVQSQPSPFLTTMAATGVTVSDEVIAQFNEVKLGRQKAKWIIYKIDGRFREWVLWGVNGQGDLKG